MNYRCNPIENIVMPDPGNLGRMFFQPPWRDATPAEIDAYLLTEAKGKKITECKASRDLFLAAGFQYSGAIICPVWRLGQTYELDDLVQGSDKQNYRSLEDKNLDQDPVSSPEAWEIYHPAFRMTSDVLLNLKGKCVLDPGTIDKYKFYAKSFSGGDRAQIDFGTAVGWDMFMKLLFTEEDRVMRKYNAYRTQIAKCSTVAQVSAIVIDYSQI